MQEGESELGGLKIPHGNTTPPSSTPGPQPEAFSAAPSQLTTIPNPTPQPTPVQPVQSPQPPQSFQQFQSPQPLRSPRQSQSPQPFPTQPIATNTPNQPPATPPTFPSTSTPSAAVFPSAGDIVLDEPKSKNKAKKWIIAAIVAIFAVTGIIVSIPLISNLLQPEITKEEYKGVYSSILNYSTGIDDLDRLIDFGINDKISIFRLFILDYIENQNNISLIFSDGALIGRPNIIPDSLENNGFSAINGFNEYNDYLESVQQLNISVNVKNAVKDIQNLLPEYAEVSQAFLGKMRDLRYAFYNGTPQDLTNFTTAQGFSSDVSSKLLKYKDQYNQIVSTWERCSEDPGIPDCISSISTDMLYVMDKDTETVRYIFDNFIDKEGQKVLEEFGLARSNLSDILGRLSL